LAPLERHGRAVLHDLVVPGNRANLDHVVIGPGGVFVIDSKQYRGRLQVDAVGKLWHGRYHLAPASRTLEAVTASRLSVRPRSWWAFSPRHPCRSMASPTPDEGRSLLLKACTARSNTLPIYASGRWTSRRPARASGAALAAAAAS
jgi:hypothetical protein